MCSPVRTISEICRLLGRIGPAACKIAIGVSHLVWLRCHRDMERSAENAATSSGTVRDQFATFEEMYPSLRRFAAVVADLDMDPDDLVQDALASTLQRDAFDELDQPLAYLKRAIVHRPANKRRRAGRLRALLPRLNNDTSKSDVYPSDLAVLDELAPLDRAVIFLADVEGEPHERIAAELGLTPAAVRKRASRARRQLRSILHPQISAIRHDGVDAAESPGIHGDTESKGT